MSVQFPLSLNPFLHHHPLNNPSRYKQPNRALHVIKRSYPRETFETTLYYFLYSMWSPPNANMSLAENVAKALSEVTVGFNGSVDPSAPKLFTPEQVKSIMQAAGSDEAKEALTKATQEALKRGAFGNPWMWVTNSEGKGEPFFGSDRYVIVLSGGASGVGSQDADSLM